jgi:PTS system nitrogen regulatory IIA component
MSDLKDLILPKAIVAQMAATTRRHAILGLSDRLAKAADLDPRRVVSAVLTRERQAGTGIGEGVAIPHAIVDDLERPVGGFARLNRAADFRAMDGRPADLVFMLLTPKGRHGDHLRALARISRFFKRAETRARLRAARSHDEIFTVFSRELLPDPA